MDASEFERLRRVFTQATARLEEAHVVAMEGQGAGLPVERYADLAARLCRMARDINDLAGEIAVTANGGNREGNQSSR